MNMRVLSLVAAAAAALFASGCASTPSLSQLTGQRWLKAELNTYDVIIISVDGKHYIERPSAPVMVDPGPRSIVVQGPPVVGFSRGEQRTLKLDVKPCTRYWLEAKKSSALAQDFEPRVNHTEALAGCTAK
jgi:hypothetical protein